MAVHLGFSFPRNVSVRPAKENSLLDGGSSTAVLVSLFCLSSLTLSFFSSVTFVTSAASATSGHATASTGATDIVADADLLR